MRLLIALALLSVSCTGEELDDFQAPDAADQERLREVVSFLAADELQGRAAGTEGNRRARSYLADAMEGLGVEPLIGSSLVQEFELRSSGRAANVVGVVPARESAGDAEPSMVLLSAHFDHLGVRDGEIYNGADDNASGVAAVLELARRAMDHRLHHDLVIALFDAEERALQGATALFRTLSKENELDRLHLHLNLDMVARPEGGPLFVAGTAHAPDLRPLVARLTEVAPIPVEMGHDTPSSDQDWTHASDHAVFHRAGIPFLYFGVEDHAGYHQPGDDVEHLDFDFLAGVVDVVWSILTEIDGTLAPHPEPGS